MFSKFKKPYSIWVLVGGFNFWLGAYNVPEGFSANPYGEAWSAEFDGTGGRVGRVDGPEKCPLNFFILCGYIDYVYDYLYTYR